MEQEQTAAATLVRLNRDWVYNLSPDGSFVGALFRGRILLQLLVYVKHQPPMCTSFWTPRRPSLDSVGSLSMPRSCSYPLPLAHLEDLE